MNCKEVRALEQLFRKKNGGLVGEFLRNIDEEAKFLAVFTWHMKISVKYRAFLLQVSAVFSWHFSFSGLFQKRVLHFKLGCFLLVADFTVSLSFFSVSTMFRLPRETFYSLLWFLKEYISTHFKTSICRAGNHTVTLSFIRRQHSS